MRDTRLRSWLRQYATGRAVVGLVGPVPHEATAVYNAPSLFSRRWSWSRAAGP
jgi:hypothetical protein